MVNLVGKRLDLRREEAGITVTELGERSGVNKSQVSRILKGSQNNLSAGNFFALCEALALDPLRAWYGELRRPASVPPPASQKRPSKAPPR